MFDELIVAVVNASVRKSKSLFNAEERIAFIERATAHLANVRVEPFDKLVVDFAREQGGEGDRQRTARDLRLRVRAGDEPAQPPLASDVESVYLMASPQYSFLSSSGVKEIATFGGDVSGLVPEEVARRLQEALGR